jgi:hypothetical protein
MRGRYEIVCETRRGFHASLGRGDPCTQYKRRGGTSSLLEGVGGRGRGAASRPAGEGSGPQATSEVGCRPSFLLPASSRDPSLCHPERSLRSEGSRASARTAAIGDGHRSVRRDSSPQRLRMTQKNIEPSCASRPMPKNLTPNPFPRGKGDNRRK